MLYARFYIQCKVMNKTNDTFSLTRFVELFFLGATQNIFPGRAEAYTKPKNGQSVP